MTFAVTDGTVASIDGTALLGKTAGTVQVYLSGREVGYANDVVIVSDTGVTATGLQSALVTGVTWGTSPSTSWDSVSRFDAAALVSQSLTVEGASGLVFSQVLWSDGKAQYVDATDDAALSALALSTDTANVVLTAPGGSSSQLGANGEDFWRAEVAFGATNECVGSGSTTVDVSWSVCGVAMSSGTLNVYVNVLPKKISTSTST